MVLNRTSAAGGERRPITVRDESKQETSHLAPHVLPDGRRYLYQAWSPQQANSAVYVASLDSNDRTKLLSVQSKAVYAHSVQSTTGAGGLFALPLFGDRRPITIADTPFAEDEPRFSKDGRWVAYNSDESGTHQVYVVSFPAIDQKRQISTDGGVQPRWRRDGQELFYLALHGRIMAVDVRFDSTIDVGIPRPLFNTRLSVDPIRDQFAVAGDGQRFLVQAPVLVGAPTPITVLVNWHPSRQK